MAQVSKGDYYTNEWDKPLRHPNFNLRKEKPLTKSTQKKKPLDKPKRELLTQSCPISFMDNKTIAKIDIELSDKQLDVKNYYTPIVLISMTVTKGNKNILYMFAVCDLDLKCGTMCFKTEKEMLEMWKYVMVCMEKCDAIDINNDVNYLFGRCGLLGVC